jgi:hypothetical protein
LSPKVFPVDPLTKCRRVLAGDRLTQVNTNIGGEPANDGDWDLAARGQTIYRFVK